MPESALSARGQQRRLQILQAAMQLFASPGFNATSLRDIASAAGISHAGLARHYSTKAEILEAILRRLEPALPEAERVDDGGSIDRLLAYAETITTRPDIAALITSTYGSASAFEHPLHEHLRARHAQRVAVTEKHMKEMPGFGEGRDPHMTGRMFSALWDGLQLAWLFAPDIVDIPATISRYHEDLHLPAAAPMASTMTPPPVNPAVPLSEDKRDIITARSQTLFTSYGFAATSMQDIADASGMAKSTLFHYFSSKEDILFAVLDGRDAHTAASIAPLIEQDPRAALFEMCRLVSIDGCARTENATYALVCHEAVPTEHPLHDYVEGRLRAFNELITALMQAAQKQGALPADRDPAHEALVLMSLWTGAHVQRLYEPTLVDTSAILTEHLRALLRPAA